VGLSFCTCRKAVSVVGSRLAVFSRFWGLRLRTQKSNRDNAVSKRKLGSQHMRALLLFTARFGCALMMGWVVYPQPTSAGNDNAPIVGRAADQPDFSPSSAVAEEKREVAVEAQCEARAAKRQIAHDDKIAFISKCLQTMDSGQR
jgi:hypothetical protein